MTHRPLPQAAFFLLCLYIVSRLGDNQTVALMLKTCVGLVFFSPRNGEWEIWNDEDLDWFNESDLSRFNNDTRNNTILSIPILIVHRVIINQSN